MVSDSGLAGRARRVGTLQLSITGLFPLMSEAELHLLRARLIGGMMNKARRGELRMRLPVGFAYDGADRVVLDPDQQVQQALRMFFETFRRVGSATATVKEFRRLKLRFPRRVQHGARKGEILWGELAHHRARWVLHHPRYAGVFCYGRSRQRKHGDARYRRLPREEWCCFPLYLVRAPHELTGLFRRRISWDDGAIRDTSDRGEAAFLMTDGCRSDADAVARAALGPRSQAPA